METENRKLHDLCGHLNAARERSKKECSELKTLGSYTARVLTDEVARCQSIDKAFKGQVERLVRENRELQDMCVALDRGAAGGGTARLDKGLTPPDVAAAVVYADVVSGVGVVPPHYSVGPARGSTLKDSEAIERGALAEYSKETALVKMKKRLEKVEAEKVELMKVRIVSPTSTVGQHM